MNERIQKVEAQRAQKPAVRVYFFESSDADSPVGTASVHCHDELELMTVYEGSLLVRAVGREYSVLPGETVFLNSRVLHSAEPSEGTRYGSVQLRVSDFGDAEAQRLIRYVLRFRGQVGSPVRVFSDESMAAAVDAIIKECRDKEPSYTFFVRAYANELIGKLCRAGALPDADAIYLAKEMQKILPEIGYINQNFCENITLESASERLGFDPSYFCRIFKAATGSTFTEYLNFVRICKAESLLLKSPGGILEISETVGFSSVSYFNRIFKRYRGCSPRAYRASVGPARGEYPSSKTENN